MKNILSILFIAVLAMNTQAQDIDADRMHRDLEVAENALSTIITPNKGQFPKISYYGKENISAEYLKDYGVIFSVSNSGYGTMNLFTTTETIHSGSVLEERVESSEVDGKAHFIENSKVFLADYASIIGQLNDKEMISIRKGGSDMHVGHIDLEKVYFAKSAAEYKVKAKTREKTKKKEKAVKKDKADKKDKGKERVIVDVATPEVVWGSNMSAREESEIIIEASVGKINDLRKGKISREEFFKSVRVEENIRDFSKDADLETLSAMFSRLYEKDLSDTYYCTIKPKYSKLTNFGTIIKMKFYSSYEDNGIYSMPTIGKKGLTLEERDNHVMELLPKFESDFKENLVNYGRTLKNLDSDEVLMFEINMTTCKDCNNFPRYMKFSIKKSDLHKYNKGSLSMKDAIKKVNVERISK